MQGAHRWARAGKAARAAGRLRPGPPHAHTPTYVGANAGCLRHRGTSPGAAGGRGGGGLRRKTARARRRRYGGDAAATSGTSRSTPPCAHFLADLLVPLASSSE